ncbi:uncharacterized protein HMPREF1120_08351 [Exophiala dermatitidis NIH/UT8656]|uniref:Uncharacterized protein n=1 Tax=Exophiala dermatitidis (strain ATCC 34100 / CBS 525.76 / NIH/UT8656) TaxID=858893 RepID=H6C8F9_EXODN|nr:uncharacterized protein HMPREF1120_08351 [Exophiala dermatitidis NIH/UT8656]EHY60386.1 hypothetical protein HMPREF1120_08351 [Exophiala dermatitidis NIH/UT8656]
MEGQKLQYYSTTANVVWSPLEGEFRLHQLPKRNQTQPLQLLFRFLNLNHATVPQVDAIVAASGLRLEICLRFLGFPSRRVSHRPRVVAAMTRTHRGIRVGRAVCAYSASIVIGGSISGTTQPPHLMHSSCVVRHPSDMVRVRIQILFCSANLIVKSCSDETAADSEHPAVWIAVVAPT